MTKTNCLLAAVFMVGLMACAGYALAGDVEVSGDLSVDRIVFADQTVQTTAAQNEQSGRAFYLTAVEYASTEAPSACGPGFHFGHYFELLELSHLDYEYDHPQAATSDASGHSVTIESGWIMTSGASTENTKGIGDCNGWVSESSGARGTVAIPDVIVESINTLSSGYGVTTFTKTWVLDVQYCHVTEKVWCVQDKP